LHLKTHGLEKHHQHGTTLFHIFSHQDAGDLLSRLDPDHTLFGNLRLGNT
jgi:hypothetical protein